MNVTDPITHGLIGISVSALSGHSPQLNDPIFLGSVIGAVVPDIDIVAHVRGRLSYLMSHRGPSHSFLALTGMALGISTILYYFFPGTSWSSIFFWTLLGTFSHGVSDLLNSYGAELLWPFYKKKLTINMAMLTDPIIFLTFLLGAIINITNSELVLESSIMSFFLATVYIMYRELGRQKVKHLLARTYHIAKKDIQVIPVMYKPFSWNFLLIQKEIVRFGSFKNSQPHIKYTLPRWNEDDPYVAKALQGLVANIFLKFTPHFHVIRTDDEGCTIKFLDLRYWANEDFIYSGKVIMNDEGEISQETFHWESRSNGVILNY